MKAFLYRLLAYLTALVISLSSALPFGGGAKQPVRDDFTQCKNVIFLIGDGMGFNSIEMAEQYLGRELTAFDGFELYGESETDPATLLLTTDSAAGGTALATGVRVSLKTVGVYPDDLDAERSYPMNLTELAISQGKAAGIVTTAAIWDATPADFSAHVSYRENYADILEQQIAGGLTLLWGKKDAKSGAYKNIIRENGYEILWDKEDIDAFEGEKRSFGLFNADNFYGEEAETEDLVLSDMLPNAIDILDNDEDGFFLMAEAAHIDKYSDDMDGEGMARTMEDFDKAIRYCLDYAEENGDTLVVLTADHETGGIVKLGGKYIYTTTMHTGKNVPLYVYGCDNFISDGEAVENREVARRIARVMGEKNFPAEVKVAE